MKKKIKRPEIRDGGVRAKKCYINWCDKKRKEKGRGEGSTSNVV
jgi:hypothetical protein